MTTTTDTAALRERLVSLNRAYGLISSPATMEQANTSAHMFVKAGGINHILAALDQLEALKGEQVPIAWLNDAHLARGHIEGEAGEEDAGPGMIPVYREQFAAPLKPVSPPVGEIVAWSGTNHSMGITRNIDFRFFRFDVKPGTKLYVIEPAPAVKSDLLTRAQALAVETRALASRIQTGE